MAIDEELSALMDRFFRAVSFGAGEMPAYERLHDLFTPAGRLVTQFVRAPGGWRITSMAWDDEA